MHLFRKAAIDHQRSRLEGELVIVQPVSHYALLLLLTGLVVSLGLYLAWGTYRQKQLVQGHLLPRGGVVKVFAPQGSTIVAAEVEEGRTVAKGELLFSLSRGPTDTQGKRLDRQLLASLDEQRRTLEGDLKRVSTRGDLVRTRLSARRRHLREEISRMRSLLLVRGRQRELSEHALETAEGLAVEAPGLVTSEEMGQFRGRELEGTLQVQELELSIAIKNAELENIELELRSSSLQQEGDQAKLERGLSELQARQTSQGSEQAFSLVAPVAGRVTAVQAVVGQFVAWPTPLCAIVPEGGGLQARVYVPTRAAGWVRPGQKVRLMYDAFPHEHYGVQSATVESVAEVILQPREVDSPVPLQEPVYAATLELDSQSIEAFGKRHRLQSGMTLTGHVLLEERSLLRWLLRPLYALGNR